jgi:hypothetical protein
MASWSIGSEDSECLTVEILGPPAKDEGYDWIPVRVKIRAGAFSGNFSAYLLAREIVKFKNELETLHKNLKGTAKFETIEEQLLLKINVDKLGHISISGEVRDEAGTGNRLIFEMSFDQTYLSRTIRELEEVVVSFS